ncbi:MAG: hypothetical protein K2L13_01295, partial [Opitutales bacterium]|nr:hypothetical protein [Opitutales bacterium]
MSKVGKNNPPQGTGPNNEIDQNATNFNTGTVIVKLKPNNNETLQSPNHRTQKKDLTEEHAADSTKDPQSKHLSPAENTSSKPNDSTTNNNTEDAHIGQDHTQNANLNASAEGINDLLSPQINTLDLNSPQSTQEVNNISNSVTLIKDEKYGGFRVLVEGMSIPFETQDAAEKFKNEYEKLEKECGKLISKNEEQAERLKALGSSMENFNSISIMRLGGYINMAIGFATGNEKLFEEKSADEKQFWDYQTPDEVKITAIEYLKELQSAVEPVINHLEVKLLSDGLLSSNEPLESKLENEIFNNDHST